MRGIERVSWVLYGSSKTPCGQWSRTCGVRWWAGGGGVRLGHQQSNCKQWTVPGLSEPEESPPPPAAPLRSTWPLLPWPSVLPAPWVGLVTAGTAVTRAAGPSSPVALLLDQLPTQSPKQAPTHTHTHTEPHPGLGVIHTVVSGEPASVELSALKSGRGKLNFVLSAQTAAMLNFLLSRCRRLFAGKPELGQSLGCWPTASSPACLPGWVGMTTNTIPMTTNTIPSQNLLQGPKSWVRGWRCILPCSEYPLSLYSTHSIPGGLETPPILY